jgi:multiple antibiotic resistance protein
MIFLKTVTTLFFLMNSIGTMPIFLALTSSLSWRERIRVALTAVSSAVGLAMAFVWAGESLINFFGFSIPAFQLGGGIILFRIGTEMLNCSVDLEKILRSSPPPEAQKSNAVAPLGIPLLTGPGTVAVVMTMSMDKAGFAGPAGLSLALLTAGFAAFLVWVAGGYFCSVLRARVITDLVSRLGGLFLLILSVQMMINGVKTIFSLQ